MPTLMLCQAGKSLRLGDNKQALVEDDYYKKYENIIKWVSSRPEVLNYNIVRHEITGCASDSLCMPQAFLWPNKNNHLTYEEKMIGSLPIASGKGLEIGPLNLPIISKSEANVYYVDHLSTEGLKNKYAYLADEIAEVDYVADERGLFESLKSYAPFDYIVGSQIMEHTPNPIRWMQDAANLLCDGGKLSIALPTRLMTFDFLRRETSSAQMLCPYYADSVIPEMSRVYDHHALTRAIHTPYITELSVSPDEVIEGKGSVSPLKITENHMEMVEKANQGEYLDVHAWVFTDWSFLMEMAQLAGDGFIPFSLQQFYPTGGGDRGEFSFIAILTKSKKSPSELRKSFLRALAPA